MPKNRKPCIRNVDDLCRQFLRALKEVSACEKQLTFETLRDSLEQTEEIAALLETAEAVRSRDVNPYLKDKITALTERLEEHETDRIRYRTQITRLEAEMDRFRDFMRRVLFLLLGLTREGRLDGCMAEVEKLCDLMGDGAELDRLEEAFSGIRTAIMKMDIEARRSSRPGLLGVLRGQRKESPEEIARRMLRKTAAAVGPLIDSDQNEDLKRLEERIVDGDDLEYILSLGLDLMRIVEEYIGRMEREQAETAEFIRTVGERLEQLESSLGETTRAATDSAQLVAAFTESLRSELSLMEENVRGSNTLDSLKHIVLSRLETLSGELTRRREEITIRVESSNREQEGLLEHLQQVVGTLRNRNRVLAEHARRDSLTGLLNRRAFDERLAGEFERHERYGTTFSVIFFDIDCFKVLNDTYGHKAGDRALKGIAQVAGSVLRKTDVFARYGGEEFAVILSETDADHACTAAEKLRELVASTEFEYKGGKVHITISVGVTQVRDQDRTAEDVIGRSDRHMYLAKKLGRNRVAADEDAAPMEPPVPEEPAT